MNSNLGLYRGSSLNPRSYGLAFRNPYLEIRCTYHLPGLGLKVTVVVDMWLIL